MSEPEHRRPDTQTRRHFLVRLARASAFVPPLMLTYEIAAAQGPPLSPTSGGKGKGKGKSSISQPAWSEDFRAFTEQNTSARPPAASRQPRQPPTRPPTRPPGGP